MAWLKTSWTYVSTDELDQDEITVCWTWIDDVDAGIQKKGMFTFTLTGANTWTVEKAAIQTKVTNGDGADA